MSVKAFVKCPTCEQNGITSILGELKPTGHLVIQRFYQYQSGKFHKEYTIIGGDNFFIVCAKCGETVYFKKAERRENEMHSYWGGGIYRQGTLQGTTPTGTLGSVFA